MKAFWFVAITAFIGLGFSAARGQVINLQFTDGFDSVNGDMWSSSVSPLAYTGTTWNSSWGSGSGSNLADSNDNSTIVGFAITGDADTTVSNNGSPAALDLFGATYLSYGDTTMTLTLTGLTSNQAYDLYFVSAYDGVYGGTFKIGSTPLTSVGNSGDSTFQSGQNYVEFTNIVPVSNQIVVTVTSPNASYGMINAIQIEAVPEPSTYAMMLGGMALLGFCVRRRLTMAS